MTAIALTVPETGPASANETFGNVLRSEWTKFRSVRSTPWCLAIFALLAVGTSVVVSVVAATSDYGAGTITMGGAVSVVQIGVGLGELAILVLGVLTISGEYRSGMISASLMSVPRRGHLLAAKALVFAAVTFVVSLAVTWISLAIQLATGEVLGNLADAGVLRSLFGFSLYLTVLAVFAMAFGAITRHPAGGILTMYGVFYILPGLLSLIPATDKVVEFMPGTAAVQIFDMTASAPWAWFGVYCAWAAAALGLATYLMHRRDA